MDIRSCKACEACSRNGGHCPQKDDMEIINETYLWADVIKPSDLIRNVEIESGYIEY